jgi:nicotinamide-nucleotide amidase
LIERVGAVSEEVALALAEGARSRLGTDFGIGVTGIAGPGGATPGKPVGLVYLCVAGPDQVLPRKVVLPGTRGDVRGRTVIEAMHMLRELLTS